MSTTNYEFVTVTCSGCPAERTCGKRPEAELPDWTCGPCRREERDLYFDGLSPFFGGNQ